MRGIGYTFSRLPAARAFIAGAALLAGFAATEAYADTVTGSEDTALAVPRVRGTGAGVALPQPLAPSDAARLRRIFALQARGDIPAALQETANLDSDTELLRGMRGHILAQRYLGRFTRPGAEELRAWLDNWGDLPDAPAIYALLLVRLPHDAKPPPAPIRPAALAAPQAAPVPEETEPAGIAINRNPSLDRAVHDAVRSGKPYAAARLIERTPGLSIAYAGLLRGEAAQILFMLNRDEEAYNTAATAAGTCGRSPKPDCQDAALPAYMAGLAAWRMGQFDRARPMFAQAWRAEFTTSALRAGAAFWAARTYLQAGERMGAVPWMARAAAQENTFYGLLARRTLGLAYGLFPADRETLTEADIDAVAATPEGLRAFALLQIGETARAEAELRYLWSAAQQHDARVDVPLGRAIMLVAARAGMADLAASLADIVQAADGQPRAGTRFPVPRLRPSGGFTVDPAMIYALARTESNFDPSMVSPAGASGLMQIMPETARFIVRTSGGNAGSLHDPSVNLDLGQRYVNYLAGHDLVAGDLIRLLASYNSGPGNFARWGPGIHDNGDPLLFIEAIPLDETRTFVPRVLTYTWIYAARMHLPTPSLDELASGQWPRYHAPAYQAGTTTQSLSVQIH